MAIQLTPSCVRSAGDDYACTVDLSATDVFDASPVTSGTLSVSSPTGLTLGSVTVAANVCTFRVSGGTARTVYRVTLTATNGTDALKYDLVFDTR
jgi:hypothetical protein